DTPGLRRPITTSHQQYLLVRQGRGKILGSHESGTTISACNPISAPVKPGGITPTIVKFMPSTVIARPIVAGFRPNCAVQRRSLITTTALPDPSSAAVKKRPTCGFISNAV